MGIKSAFFGAAALIASATSAQAATILESEPNNSFVTAQVLNVGSFDRSFDSQITASTVVPHLTINNSAASYGNQYDYFKFGVGVGGGRGIFDTDNIDFDVFLALFRSDFSLLTYNDDSSDPISDGNVLNSYIDTFLPQGNYFLRVGACCRDSAGQFEGTQFTGAYRLNVSVANAVTVDGAVPEPSTWAMMLVGFGAIGFAMRRKRNAQARVTFAF